MKLFIRSFLHLILFFMINKRFSYISVFHHFLVPAKHLTESKIQRLILPEQVPVGKTLAVSRETPLGFQYIGDHLSDLCLLRRLKYMDICVIAHHHESLEA